MPLAGRRAGRASWEAMALVAMSRHLSFHARGDAVFVWHGLTGDVAEMSRDVLALLLAFDPRADEAEVKEAPPAGLARELVEEFVPVLRSRRFLVASAPRGKSIDEYSPLLAGYPRVPRNAVFHRRGNQVTVYGRGTPMELDARTASLFLRCDGERTLGQVLGDAGPAALPPLLRLARADVAALKILAKAVSHGGVALNPAAESTMPYPELADARAYAAGDPPRAGGSDRAAAEPEEHETTLAHLFRAPHPALKGRTFGAAVPASSPPRCAMRSRARCRSRAGMRRCRRRTSRWTSSCRTRRPAAWTLQPRETASSTGARCSWCGTRPRRSPQAGRWCSPSWATPRPIRSAPITATGRSGSRICSPRPRGWACVPRCC